ncbi:MAG: peptidoglycan-binding protein [Roseburia sp.]|nr:peptidoglycan-binding protein [Roseburia sp.]
MENTVIAVVDDASCDASPVMPYIGARIDGKEIARIAKLDLSAALLRCGFDTVSRTVACVADAQELYMQINRGSVDAAVILSCGAFGSRKTFNDKCGSHIRFSQGRFLQKSKTLCEDICAKLWLYGLHGDVFPDPGQNAANCPTAVIDVGYLTNFDEAKLLCDPDRSIDIAEYIARGICEHFDMPYIKRDDIFAYPMLCTARRGKKVKMLQTLLDMYGFDLAADGVFGAVTENAVKRLCENNGKPTGAVTAAVWRDLLLTNIPEKLSIGSRDNFVWYIQHKLRSKLYDAPVNGVLDEQTLRAFNEYLCESNLNALYCDGAVSGDAIRSLAPIGGGRPRLF